MPERRRRNRIVRRLAVFGPAAIVVLTGVLAIGALRRLSGTRQAVQHTHDVLDASTRALTAILDAETATRGFAITRDSTFLAPAVDAPQRASRALADLRALTVDNGSQRRRIDSLDVRITLRLRVLDSVADLVRRGEYDLSDATVRRGPGPQLMADSRRIIREIQREEDSLLVVRRGDERRAVRAATFVVIVGALLAAFLAFLVNRNYDAALRDRRRALDEAENANLRLQENAVELENQAEAAHLAQTIAEESEQRAERLQAATEALTGALEIGDVATLIVDQAVRAVGAHSGALATLDRRAAQLTIVATRNVSAAPVGTTFALDAPLPMPTAAREGRPLIVSNIDEKNRRFPGIAPVHDPDGIESFAAYPLRIGGEVTGVILVRFTEPHDLDAADHAFMSAMSRIAAEAFERARLFEAERNAREEAETANRAKAAFLASMSHELRTPLQAALGFAQLVRSGVYGPVNEQQVEVLGRVERSQTHLARLIDDILDFARLEAGRVRVESEPVPLAEVLGDLFPLVEPQAVKKRIELAVLPPEDGMTVMADRHRLQQVLVNLVGNAIKFTPENGTIRVGALADERTARIFIRDTGRGIPADRLQSIFEPFVQVEDSLMRTASGAGLGLAISRDLARAMGGDLSVESEFGVGSTFTITLPLV